MRANSICAPQRTQFPAKLTIKIAFVHFTPENGVFTLHFAAAAAAVRLRVISAQRAQRTACLPAENSRPIHHRRDASAEHAEDTRRDVRTCIRTRKPPLAYVYSNTPKTLIYTRTHTINTRARILSA